MSNNPSKLDPPFILHPEAYYLDSRIVLHISIPESSLVHRTAGVVFDRSHDGDFKVSQPAQIALLYNRKHSYYTEATIYPGLTISDFREDLLIKVRSLIRSQAANHPWLELTDEQLLRKSDLLGKDPRTNQEGFNLAAVLLIGKDETILNVVPHYKIDALVRRKNQFRYDDRLYIQTNLIDAYDLLMAFIEKHLPDTFFIEGNQRISLRAFIFREVVANLLVHREYTDGFPATFIIHDDRVEINNANNPHGNGLLLPDQFVPFPKNPIIAKFFMQLGRVEELGSGVLNVYKYLRYYSPGKEPEFIEDRVFKTTIPLNADGGQDGITSSDAINDAISIEVKQRLVAEIKELSKRKRLTLTEVIDVFKVACATAQRDIKLLRDIELVQFRGSKKAGAYELTEKGKALFYLK